MSFIGYLLVTSANAYPTNTVSTASNPIFAFGGQTAASSTSTLVAAPADQRMIITDIVITMVGNNGNDPCYNRVSIQTGAGNMADFVIASDTFYQNNYMPPGQISHSYRSGIPVEPNDSFGITNHGSVCTISYSLSGYYAQP